MIKIIYRTLIVSISLLLILVFYLSVVGIKTNKFNSNIISYIKKIEPDLKLKLSKVSAKLNLFNFEIDIKTIGTDLIYRDKIIKIQSINSNISLISFLKSEFAITGISISTKPLEVKDLMVFMRLLNNDPKIFIAEQFIKKGFVVTDLTLVFDELGNIKNNYKIKGLVKDGRIDLFKNYNLDKIDFTFEIVDKNLRFNDVKLLLNNKKISIPELNLLKKNNEYFVSGKLNNQSIMLNKNEIESFIKKEILGLDIQQIIFSSQNNFGFEIDKNFKFRNFNITSQIELENLRLKNSYNLRNIFPDIKKEIFLKNQKIKLKYEKDNLSIIGNGEALLQNEIDKIEYEIFKRKNILQLDTTLNISLNPFKLKLLNYQKNEKSVLELNLKVKQVIKNQIIFDEIYLKEKNNIISVKELILSNDYKIDSIKNVNFDYLDKENLKNKSH